MELDAPAEPLQLDELAGSAPSSSLPASKEAGKDPERFYCPYPGCNRSFAELWRLKVHFRAPPDIRGSGKERGHGTELTHCPKCEKTLKAGKHHVGCSGSKANARQASKRSRPAGDADAPDDALAASPQPKHAKSAELDMEPLTNAWQQEYARSQGAHIDVASMALQPPLKQEQQDWPPAMQHGISYGQNGATAACWLPGHVNGFVPQLQPHGYSQPQFTSELQFAGSTHGYAQQMSPYPSLPGYSQPGMSLTDSGQQVLSMPPGGSIQHLQPPSMLGLMYHQQPHTAPQLLPPVHMNQHNHQSGAPLHHQHSAAHAQEQPPTHLHNGTAPHAEQQLEGRSGESFGRGGGGGGDCGGGDGGGAGGTDGDGAVAPAAAADAAAPPKPSNSNDSLGSVFGDVEEFTRDFGRIPSPPPLPMDFHSASGGGGSVLFNFAQFGQKLPRSQSNTRLDRNLYGFGLEPGVDGDLYDHTDDGDLMQLLFGVPDELPTMATIHLHKWNNAEDEDGDRDQQGGGDGPARSGAVPMQGPGSAAAAGGQHGSAAAERSGGHVSAPVTAASAAQQHHLQPAQQLPHGGHAPGLNGKLEALGGNDASVPDTYLAHGGPGGGGKAALGQLVNGLNNAHHGPDEHHRDHLLDAETFRLLHSCD